MKLQLKILISIICLFYPVFIMTQEFKEIEVLKTYQDGSYMIVINGDTLLAITPDMVKTALKVGANLEFTNRELELTRELLEITSKNNEEILRFIEAFEGEIIQSEELMNKYEIVNDQKSQLENMNLILSETNQILNESNQAIRVLATKNDDKNNPAIVIGSIVTIIALLLGTLKAWYEMKKARTEEAKVRAELVKITKHKKE